MSRDRQTLTDGQWEHLGSLIGDFLWDQDRFHALIAKYLDESCITNEDRITVLFDEVLRRIEVGFARRGENS